MRFLQQSVIFSLTVRAGATCEQGRRAIFTTRHAGTRPPTMSAPQKRARRFSDTRRDRVRECDRDRPPPGVWAMLAAARRRDWLVEARRATTRAMHAALAQRAIAHTAPPTMMAMVLADRPPSVSTPTPASPVRQPAGTLSNADSSNTLSCANGSRSP